MIIEANSWGRPEIGAVLTRPKGIATHSGIYMGQDHVFDNVPEGARLVPWSIFSAGYPVTAGEKLKLPEQELWRRAHAIIAAKRKYHIADFNCDDAVNLMAGTIVRPSQFIGFALASLFLVAVAGALSSKA